MKKTDHIELARFLGMGVALLGGTFLVSGVLAGELGQSVELLGVAVVGAAVIYLLVWAGIAWKNRRHKPPDSPISNLKS